VSEHLSMIERMYRRILATVGRGKVLLGDDSGSVQILQVQLSANETRDKCYRLAEYGYASFPLGGADAVMVFIGGDRSNGVVIATGDQRYRLHLVQGEVAIHTDLGQKVHLTRTAIVIDGAGLPINMLGDVNVTGTLTASVDVVGGGKHLKTHAHGGVQTGSGNTGAPV
jgi:phage gp45-like